MVNEFLIKTELSHISKLLFGSNTNPDDTKGLLHKLKEEFGITVSVKSEGGWFGYKNYLVQVLRRNERGEYVNEHCTGAYGDNGEFQSRDVALNYGLLVACTFALGIYFKQGYMCLES